MRPGTLPSPLATSISTSYLDVSQNQLTALPLEWSEGFANATESSYVRIFLQENEIKVCPNISSLPIAHLVAQPCVPVKHTYVAA